MPVLESMEIVELFATNVELLRTALGWPKYKIADAAGIPRPECCQILLGKRNITLRTAAAIAKVLDVPLAELLTTRFDASRYCPGNAA